MTNAKPHIGTENLRIVVKNAEKYLVRHGGEIRYGVTVEKLPDCGNAVDHVSTNHGYIPCGAVVLAIGHSARDTYMSLIRCGYTLSPKPFSMGVRVEHLQSDIDAALYGRHAGDKRLPPAEYNVSRRFGNRAVYTFCMCPGGEVVAAASEEGGLGSKRYEQLSSKWEKCQFSSCRIARSSWFSGSADSFAEKI